MKKIFVVRKATSIAVAAVLITSVFAIATPPIPVSAGHVNCGDIITTDTTLDGNVTCTTTPGLIIGADDVTLDLNGFTLSGAACGSCHGIRNVGFDDVTIENGIVDGFEQGIRGEGVSDFTLKHLTLTGQTSSHAIDILDSEDVEIYDVSISIPTTTFIGPEGIRLESVNNVEVTDVEVSGAFVGVNFACGSCDGSEPPTTGVVEDSKFHDNFTGVLIANSDDAEITHNEISDGVSVVCPAGFCAAVPIVIASRGIHISFLANTDTEISYNEIFDNDGIGIRASVFVDNLEIEENDVHDNTSDGMQLNNIHDSEISENTADDNGGRGIALESGSTGNEIEENTATGNTGFDMFHDGSSTPNDWEDNSCGTSSGADIDCPEDDEDDD